MKSPHLRSALSGGVAAALGLGVSELIAGLVSSVPSLVESLGNWVIDNVPTAVKEWAITVFGTNDKLVLLVGITVVTVLIGAVVGVAARSRFGLAVAVFVGFGLVAGLTAGADPRVSLTAAMFPSAAAAIAGLATLRMLYTVGGPPPGPDPDRSKRQFLLGVGAVVAVAAIAGGMGRVLIERAKRAVAGREEVVLPTAADALSPVSEAANFEVVGLEEILVPNQDFYRIDTALSVPRVDLQEWSLSITGMVDRPYSIDFSDLLDMRMVERDITLSCVSNQVGGGLVGNARWLGVPLTEILDRAGVQPGAGQIVGRSVDDFTVGFPVDAAYDGREALVAVGMNGEPLPFEHGFPARLVVAGLYGYVSATKWLSAIDLTTWDGFDAYWVPRGWAKEAPIKTQSRIDTPGHSTQIAPGRHVVAGVAWAPTRGISMVEVQLGEGQPWVEAELSEPLSDNAWVQWRVDWDVSRDGRHLLRCRATDGDGQLQTSEVLPPAPDGATGWHTRPVFVTT
ncbi:MAG TPA: molybdopterin-dependent oxidoreductase [Acidimicrobiia bacterium]|nr:molybdopterin-dependent oxidoreductase [Acidimicrobiia bacterium]